MNNLLMETATGHCYLRPNTINWKRVWFQTTTTSLVRLCSHNLAILRDVLFKAPLFHFHTRFQGECYNLRTRGKFLKSQKWGPPVLHMPCRNFIRRKQCKIYTWMGICFCVEVRFKL